jgi:hypothetical protein
MAGAAGIQWSDTVPAGPMSYRFACTPLDTAPVSTVQVTAPFQLSDEQADKVGGVYAMSNGWRLEVQQTTRGMEARIDRQRPIRLIAVTPDKFVSRDGNVTMDFNRGEDGDGMVMSYVPDQRLAVRVVIGDTLAQR